MTVQTGFLIAEDDALKAKLTGLTVSDPQFPDGRPVKVRFNEADAESAISYPLITLQMISIALAADRVHSGGRYDLTYVPDRATSGAELVEANPDMIPEGGVYAPPGTVPEGDEILYGLVSSDSPIPVDLGYQVVAFSRHPRHNAQLVGQLMQADYLPFPPLLGYLRVDADGTCRRLECRGVSPAHTIDDERKRLFRTVFDVQVTAEMLPTTLEAIARVRSVVLDPEPLLTDQTGLIAVT